MKVAKVKLIAGKQLNNRIKELGNYRTYHIDCGENNNGN